MTELKERLLGRTMNEYGCDTKIYLKSDVDKVIAKLKHKRCLHNAWLCKKLSKAYAWFAYTHRGWKANTICDGKAELWRKWHNRWLSIADTFKEKSK